MVKLTVDIQIRLMELSWTLEDIASILNAAGCLSCEPKKFREWIMRGEMPDYWYNTLLRLLPVIERINKET